MNSSHTHPSSSEPPQHVAIIMDGNGRWACQRGLPRIEGHRKGVDNVRDVAETARDLGIRYLTLYAFSVENWKRPATEIDALMDLLYFFLRRHLKDMLKNKIRFRVIGRKDELPTRVRKPLDEAIRKTAEFTEHNLTLALNYGARTEMIDAFKGYAAAVQAGETDPSRLDWQEVSRYLYTSDIPDPDLVIRTSGESRISNFLLMQSAYAEFFFSTVYWPDFKRPQFIEAIEAYKRRERRFGKTGEQLHTDSPAQPISHQTIK